MNVEGYHVEEIFERRQMLRSLSKNLEIDCSADNLKIATEDRAMPTLIYYFTDFTIFTLVPSSFVKSHEISSPPRLLWFTAHMSAPR